MIKNKKKRGKTRVRLQLIGLVTQTVSPPNCPYLKSALQTLKLRLTGGFGHFNSANNKEPLTAKETDSESGQHRSKAF